MVDHQPFDATSHPIIKLEDDWNEHEDHAHEKCATYIIRLNGSYVEAIKGGTPTDAGTIAYGGADNVGGADGTEAYVVLQAVNDVLPYSGGLITFKDTNFEFSDQVVINRPVTLKGMGAGLLWNGRENHPTCLKWTGTDNNKPMFKILGTIDVSAETETPVTFQGMTLRQDSASTGTDGIYMDGENSIIRRVVFRDLHVINFTGSGIHAKGTVFDVRNYNVGITICDDDAYKIEDGTPFTGDPSQFDFYGCYFGSNLAGKYALYSEADQISLFGGTISNVAATSHGIRFEGSNGNAIYGTNIEGASVLTAIGLSYTGTGLYVSPGTRIISWATGVKIGKGTADAAYNWFIDATFSGNTTTDVEVTDGGSRYGALGYTSDDTLSSLTNDRYSNDAVSEVIRWKHAWRTVAVIAVGGSPYTYKNEDDCYEDIIIYGGTITTIEWGDIVAGYCNLGATPRTVSLAPGEYVRVTYTVLPTMKKRFK